MSDTPPANGTRLRAWLPLIIWLATTLVGITLAYAALQRNDAATQIQLQSHENEQRRNEVEINERLDRIENKVDRLLMRQP